MIRKSYVAPMVITCTLKKKKGGGGGGRVDDDGDDEDDDDDDDNNNNDDDDDDDDLQAEIEDGKMLLVLKKIRFKNDQHTSLSTSCEDD